MWVGITFKVLGADSDTAETLTYRGGSTSLTNPVSTTNFASDTVCADRVAFRVDPTDSGDENVDLIVVDTVGGYTAFVEDFNQYEHSIIIDERPNLEHHGMIWYSCLSGETDTGIDFDSYTFIKLAVAEVVTAATGASVIDIGLLSTETSGSASTLVSDQRIAGDIQSEDKIKPDIGFIAIDSLSSGTFDDGYFVWDTLSVAKSLSYTTTGDGGAGYIHYFFTRMR